ncbi:MAG TPA: TMEM165/GDT1 family protein [Syntrophothermus lipocalidus]|uniref:TMEM165/GDT1 family protein n=1 Tax=Syntrophothermus sp. TaxID=2736299 RepID=UPI0017A6F525|nr:TMEM165/GDT1 family protein [Syntrophothermus sp.]NSW81910.1 TMEM165/GDT1 family protein [Syntrophothermus sp.]HHV75877.1 TMEM165/GDT1 family protein [Syntrophothermus lipocalidus]HOV42565.1 TMEM165/GDT1 family protein [Syntrophothermus lipocalidus]
MHDQIITLVTTYILIAMCELGDKTQVAVLLMSSNSPGKRWLILAASLLALTSCVIIEVTVGAHLARRIGPGTFNRITGFIFLVLGGLNLINHFRVRARTNSRQPVQQGGMLHG